MKFIFNSKGIALYLSDHRPVTVSSTDSRYQAVVQALSRPPVEREQAVNEALFGFNPNIGVASKGFDVSDTEVSYQGEKLPPALAQKIRSLIAAKLPVDLWVEFWKNLKLNPDRQSALELADFLEYDELPLTEDGCFIAYKGIKTDNYSVKGNLETKVLKGTVNRLGQIYNGIGEEIEIDRFYCDNNRLNSCSTGLHAGSFDYARGWGQKMVSVKINPKDVVSVPTDCQCQKLRCCAYTVIADVTDKIKHVAVKENLTSVENEAVVKVAERTDKIVARVKAYLEKKADGLVTLQQIQNIFSPEYVNRTEICAVLSSMWYIWDKDGFVYEK